MTTNKLKKKKWLKPLLVIGLLAVVGLAVAYWLAATATYNATKSEKADFTVNAIDLIKEFNNSNTTANQKYSEKIIVVNGKVSEIEAADTTFNIKFIDSTSGSYIIFAFQQQYLAEAKTVKPGDSISVKGSCSGGIYSKILEVTAITFKRSTLNN